MTVWYIARGAGLSALVLLTVSTCLGALASRNGRAGDRFVVQYLHRSLAGLGLAVLALHVGAILADSYAGVGWAGALIPFASSYDPVSVALGTVAVYLAVGVALLGLARGRMAASPRATKVWRGLHGMSYIAWVAAMLHGLNTGTDSSATWVRLLYIVCLASVVVASAVRLREARSDRMPHVEVPTRLPLRIGEPR